MMPRDGRQAATGIVCRERRPSLSDGTRKIKAWEPFMDEYLGLHGFVVDPDTSIDDPDDLITVSLEGRGSLRLPQDCLRGLK